MVFLKEVRRIASSVVRWSVRLSFGVHFLSISAQTASGTCFKKSASFFSVWKWVLQSHQTLG